MLGNFPGPLGRSRHFVPPESRWGQWRRDNGLVKDRTGVYLSMLRLKNILSHFLRCCLLRPPKRGFAHWTINAQTAEIGTRIHMSGLPTNQELRNKVGGTCEPPTVQWLISLAFASVAIFLTAVGY